MVCSSKSKLCQNNKCTICFNRSLASHHRAEQWSDKNKLKPRDVCKGSQKKYIFDCDNCDHEFDCSLAHVTNIKDPRWCPYCSNPPKKLCLYKNCEDCLEKSFASNKKAKYWSDKNDLSAREIFKSARKKCYFDCSKCKHTFDIFPNTITNDKQWCPYCGGQKLCDDDNCNFCFEKSFASHEKSKYWSDDNDKIPRQIFKNTHHKYIFDCEVCKLNFLMDPHHIFSLNNWCPYCKKKTEKKLLKWLIKHKYQYTFQAKYEWCKNPKTSRHLPFDFAIEKYKIIIELDGMQHFEKVYKMQDPEITQSVDIYKMHCAFKNGYTIIRLLQPDVFLDKNNWEANLINSIHKYSKPSCIYFSNGNHYDVYKKQTKKFVSNKTKLIKKSTKLID